MANEMMLIGSGVLVRPVLQWDEQVIGNGKNISLNFYALQVIIICACLHKHVWTDTCICINF